MDTSQLRWPKGTPRRRATPRRRRQDSAAVRAMRPTVAARDGYCRLYRFDAGWRAQLWGWFGACAGPSELSHYNRTHRRSKTRRQDPAARHQPAHALMLCRFHAAEYDQNRMDIEELTPDGCDGALRFRRDGQTWDEPPRARRIP